MPWRAFRGGPGRSGNLDGDLGAGQDGERGNVSGCGWVQIDQGEALGAEGEVVQLRSAGG